MLAHDMGDNDRSLGKTHRRRGVTSTPALMLIVTLAALASVLCYRAFHLRFNSQLRSVVRKELSQLFPDASVFVGRVDYSGQGVIVANDLHIAIDVHGHRFPVFTAESVTIRGSLDVAHFLQQTARAEKVELVGVEIDAWPMDTGGWSVQRLKPHPKRNLPPPSISLSRASLRIRQSASTDSPELILHDLKATIEPISPPGSSSPTGQTAQSRQFHARCTGRSSGLLSQLNVECVVDPRAGSLQISGDFTDLQFSKALMDRLPGSVAGKLNQLAGLECKANCSYFYFAQASDQPMEFACQGRIQSGRLQDSRLPYPLEQISSEFFCKNSLLQLRGARAHSGEARLTIDTDIMGFDMNSPMIIEAKVQNLDLDNRLYQSLRSELQQQWDRLQLSGRVSGNLQLKYDGQNWRQNALVTCQAVSISPWLFPYPFTDIQGQVRYQDGTFSSERLLAQAGGQTVEASLSLTQVNSQWIGHLQCRSLGTVAIDQELIAALTPRNQVTRGAETFVRSLHLTGGVELVLAKFERSSPDSTTWQRTIDANIFDGRLQYEKFNYPVYNIRGRLYNQNDQWYLEGFEGRNDSARILCSGSWRQVKQGTMPFRLDFDAHAVPVAEDLFRALPERLQNVWAHLQPSGSIDRITATIARDPEQPLVQTRATIEEDCTGSSAIGQSLRLQPLDFPYLLSDVSCQVTYDDQAVTIHRASAHHGATLLAVTGNCRPRDEGRWEANLDWLPSTRLMVDGQLVRSLPQSVQESMQRLNFQGPVSILGNSQIVFGDRNVVPAIAWDCQLDVEDGQLGSGDRVRAMRGTVWTRGSSNGKQLSATGQLSMDALQVMDIPITSVQGPFVVLDEKLYFGNAVQKVLPSTQQDSTTELTASALSGTIKLSGYSALDSGKVHLDAALENANLSTLLQELGKPLDQPDALCNAYLQNFRGVPWNPQTYSGSGSIHLTDAKLYELPFMMRLFSVTSVSADDASAFQRADINFQIDGDKIPLKVAADGNVLRLRGEGWTNLRRDIQLQLYTYVGRRLPVRNVISPLLADSRFATLMMVEVDGTLDNPNMQRKPFPQLEDTLQTIFPDVAQQRPLRDAMERLPNPFSPVSTRLN